MNSKKIKPSTVLLYLALSLGAVIMVLPFLWTALSSVKSMGQIFTCSADHHSTPLCVEKLSGISGSPAFRKSVF